MKKNCESCRDYGRTRAGLAHRLPDGQRVSLCLSCATVWRLKSPTYAPKPYGQETCNEYAKTAIVGIPA